MSNTPSDEELTACYREANGEMHGKAQPLTTQRIFRAMRAAIVKWGTPQPVVREPQCWCLTCRPMRVDDPESIRMALCPTCGNKRCPKANNHRNQCSNSNEPGQKGSAYEGCGITQKGGSNADT